jgi:hypothetical protein
MRKSPARLDYEIARALSGEETAHAPTPDRFYVSDDTQGGPHARRLGQFDDLTDALDALVDLRQGSITHGDEKGGRELMIVWAVPAYTDVLYWTDGDLNVPDETRTEVRRIRDRQAKGSRDSRAHFEEHFRKWMAERRA